MAIVVENGHSCVQILDKTVCIISHDNNTFGKGMNPTILSLPVGY